MSNTNYIKCPECKTSIDVNDLLYKKLDEEIQNKYNQQITEQKNELEAREAEIAEQKAALEAESLRLKETVNEKLQEQLKAEKIKLETSLRGKIAEEQSEMLAELQKELNVKSEQVKELNRSKAEIEKLKREKNEMKEALEADAQKRFSEMLREEKKKIRDAEKSNNEMVVNELKKQLEDQKKLTEEMKRKQEQGSMQLQGEVQELAMEEWLASSFPLDTINEIKKGATGADIVQTVNTREKANCGTIYYESKRTKDFQPAWIGKFKEDMRKLGAEIGVLVTSSMPKDMPRMGMVDGIWVCTYEEFKSLCFVLRDAVVRVSAAHLTQSNKGDKMAMLYDYLVGGEFRHRVEGIVEAFTYMQNDLHKEKKATLKRWSEREKQIFRVVENTVGLYGSIKGIAGAGLPEIKLLEEGDDEDTGE